MSTRLLGIVCIVGSLIAVLDAFRMLALGVDLDTFSWIVLSLWYIGCIAAIVGMIQLNAVGSNTVVRALAFLPIIGFVILLLGTILKLAGAIPADSGSLAGIGWLVEMAGMVLVGILTIAAKVWRGWRRFLPLLTVVVVPVGIGLGSALGSQGLWAVFVCPCWALLGYVVATAVASAEPAPFLVPNSPA